MACTLAVASFNILADGLCEGEFMCEGGDHVSADWSVRSSRIVQILVSILEECDIVVTQENDHFCSLLESIQMRSPHSIGGVFATDRSKMSAAKKVKLNSQLNSILSHHEGSGNGSDLFQVCNDAFRKDMFPVGMAVSFADESQQYGGALATAFGHIKDDLYCSNDGIGIYYRTDKVTLVDVQVPGTTECNKVWHGGVTIVTNADGCIRTSFRVHDGCTGSDRDVTIYGAHLKSGEDYNSEMKRCKQLKLLLDDAEGQPFPIIAMDSNNSVQYEQGYVQGGIAPNNNAEQPDCGSSPLVLSRMIAERGYVDAVGPPYQVHGNECFKLRHGLGPQVSKHYQFMFDAIDKILVPRSAVILPVGYERERFGFQRYDPALQDKLLQLRASAEERSAFEAQCRASERVRSTTCAVAAFGQEHMLAGLYPNPRAPSDHPPVYCRLQLPL